ncbi:hypothetical protein [Nostoc sp. CHAB 5715]|uniref:DUF6888 family protein n=1 Tax=Nostoc sp. CHAB 5715 TaxID=2780400 RepID=UPI001E30D324|nr:hypothetical protein [Nostoc sp. CHAB 5715]MCC5623427.1 hypothetical protein [Nostoc sp. CHAB 5715]
MQGDALALLADALALSVDALALLVDALALLVDALALLVDALAVSADALALQGIAKFNSLRINEMLYLVCVRLSNVLLPINAVRLDERTNQIYVLAGEEIEVLIYPNGKVRFL